MFIRGRLNSVTVHMCRFSALTHLMPLCPKMTQWICVIVTGMFIILDQISLVCAKSSHPSPPNCPHNPISASPFTPLFPWSSLVVLQRVKHGRGSRKNITEAQKKKKKKAWEGALTLWESINISWISSDGIDFGFCAVVRMERRGRKDRKCHFYKQLIRIQNNRPGSTEVHLLWLFGWLKALDCCQEEERQTRQKRVMYCIWGCGGLEARKTSLRPQGQMSHP